MEHQQHRRRRPGIRTQMMCALAVALTIAVAAPPAGAQAPADDRPVAVEYRIDVRFDPTDGGIDIEEHITGLDRDLWYSAPPWLSLTSAWLTRAAVSLPVRDNRIGIPGRALAGDTLVLSMRGRVPAATAEPQDAMTGAEGGYLFGDAGWLPGPAAGLARYTVSVSVPSPWRAIATGRLVAERQQGADMRAEFVYHGLDRAPSLFFGPYTVSERLKDGLRLRTYFHAGEARLADAYLDAAEKYIRRFSDLIGPYPYAGFSVVAAPIPVGFGFDSLTYVSRRILPHPYMRGRSLAHEVAHSWWGNAVAVDYDGGNWAEGLTTFHADYGLAEDEGEAVAREMRLGWLRNLAALPAAQDRPVTAFRAKTHDAAQVIGYDKVTLIFHMLRREVGTAAFNAAIRRFWADNRFRRAGWADLRSAFAAAAGRDLGWFFDQWLTRPGVPRLSIAGLARNGDGTMTLTLRQSGPVRRLRIPVVVDGAARMRHTDVVMTQAEQSFRLAAPPGPLTVRVDPDYDTVRLLLPGESAPILRDVTLSGDTALVVPPADSTLAGAASALAAQLLHRRVRATTPDAVADRRGPVLAIGTSASIAALRDRVMAGAAAAQTRAGAARGWVEKDGAGRPWLFISANAADAIGPALAALRYYRHRSYVVFANGRVTASGVWPVTDSPLARRLAR